MLSYTHHQCQIKLPFETVHNLIARVFLRSYPKERPIIYITKWVQHQLVKPSTCEIDYEQVFKWS